MSNIIFAATMVIAPLVILGVSWLATPGYFNPVMQQPMMLVLIAVSVVWMSIGALLSFRAGPVKRGFLVVFFDGPVLLLYMLAPALFTIATALGPVMK